MKNGFRLLFLIWLLSNEISVYGQDTAAVGLSNLDSGEPIFMLAESGDSILAPWEGTFVQVLARPVDSKQNFQVLANAVGEDGFGLVGDGYFDAGIAIDIPGVAPLSTGEFLVRAWRGADTWDSALMNRNATIGKSPVFVNETGYYRNTPTPDLGAAPTLSMPSFVLRPVPEPLPYVLFICGMSLIFLFNKGHSTGQ